MSAEVISAKTELSHAEQVAFIGHCLSELPQVECPLQHHFAPGLYMREIFMPAGTVVIGMIHKTEHFNILVRGACHIMHDNGTTEELRAPKVFVSKAGVQKVLHITEDMVWLTTHPTDETDVPTILSWLVEPVPPNPLPHLANPLLANPPLMQHEEPS